MSKPKPTKEIKPVRGYGYVYGRGGDHAHLGLEVARYKGVGDISVTILATRDYRKLLADAKAYRVGKK